MNLAGHRDRRLSENYFEPCFSIMQVEKVIIKLAKLMQVEEMFTIII